MNATNEAIAWQGQREVHGFKVKCFFFDETTVKREEVHLKRTLPMLNSAHSKLLFTENDKRNFRASTLVAQPDSVYEHGGGLLSLEYKSQNHRAHRPDRWHLDIPIHGMLQCLIAAMAVASEMGKPTVPLLRCHNVVYLLEPTKAVVDKIHKLLRLAPIYWDDQATVSATELAQFCAPWIRATFPDNSEEAQRSRQAGIDDHAVMLRR